MHIYSIILTTLTISLSIITPSFGAENDNTPKDDFSLLSKSTSGHSQIFVYTDPVTGCEYLAYFHVNGIGMTARLNKNGLPICVDAKAEAEKFEKLEK